MRPLGVLLSGRLTMAMVSLGIAGLYAISLVALERRQQRTR